MEATFQREGKTLCTDRRCRGRGGGRGTLLFGALNPIICRNITKWQCNSSWNRRGRQGCVLFPQKSNQSFCCVIVQELLHREHSLPDVDDRLGHLSHCSKYGHTKLCSLRREWWSSETRTAMQSRGLDQAFPVLCIWNLFIQSDFILNTRSKVQPEYMRHLGSKYHFSTLLEGSALLFTLNRVSSSEITAIYSYKYNAKN